MVYKIDFFKLAAITIALSFSGIAFSQVSESCFLYSYGSAAQNACNARNQDRDLQERRYKEDQNARKEDQEKKSRDDALQRMKSQEAFELQKKQEASEARTKIAEKQKRDLEERQASQASSDHIQNKKIELLGDLIVMNELATKSYFKRSTNLADIGKCKESLESLEKGSKNEEKRARAVIYAFQGTIAEKCDKSGMLGMTYYFKSVENGSVMGKVMLDEFVKKSSASGG